MDFKNRISLYTDVSADLESLDDKTLIDLLDKATPMYTGIGGQSVLLRINGTPIFVKKVPLTDLERQPENVMSTANLFNLPLFYQYGVGSAGFGAWRELTAHIMTTNWVLSGECPNFPMMYHWRVLPASNNEPQDTEQSKLKNLERDVKYWEHSQPIRNRLEAINNASAHIYLFLEYVPHTLYDWLGNQVVKNDKSVEKAVSFVAENLKITNAFMNEHGLLHFDAHLENILTDGNLIYFSDFGLALSSNYELSKAEIDFFNRHLNYDQCSTITNLLHCIITHLFGKDNWEISLRLYLDGGRGELSPALSSMIRRYAPIALTMDTFYRKLQKQSKSTPYPTAELDCLLSNIGMENH